MHSIYFCSWYDTIRAMLPSGFFYNLIFSFRINEKNIKMLDEKEKEIFLKLKEIKTKTKLNFKIKELQTDDRFKEIIRSLINKNFLVSVNENKRKILNKDVFMLKISEKFNPNLKLTAKQQKLLDCIKTYKEISLKKACYLCGVTSVVAKNLLKLGAVDSFEKHDYRMPYKDVKITSNLQDISLTEEQNQVKNGILDLIKSSSFKIALLHGVTGSGKTQIFLKLIHYVIAKGKDVILLVPEISITTQIVSFFQSFFGDLVAVLHSGILKSEQMDEYLRILKGKAKLIIGTRSAVFAPCKNLGLVVMDEEEGSCYKSSDMSPRYDAKDVAKYRCYLSKSVLVLASATPSIVSSYFADRGVYKKFNLKHRYSDVGLPKVFVVNMLKAKSSPVDGISNFLFKELVVNFNNKEQSIIFLNRRGYNLNAFCVDCGSGVKCNNCSAFMVYHKINNSFMCHYCGAVQENIQFCSNCHGNRLIFCGQGTQNLEDHIKEKIEGVRVLRLDSDTIFSRSDLEKKIKQFENKEYDILIGTQIVARGLNFLNVTLVGVFSIDGALYGSDFKSSERVFSLLTQVIGRSGRGNKKGRAIIQTYNPENKIISWAAKQNYDVFYQNEIIERKEFFCPPFCDLCIVNFTGFDERKILTCAREFILNCKTKADFKIPFKLLGISTPYIEMLNKKHRRRIIIKCKNSSKFREWIKSIFLEVFSSKKFSGIRANIDINGDII